MIPLAAHDVAWVKRGLPPKVFAAMEADPAVVLAGGFIRARIAGETPSDIDLFAVGGNLLPDALAKALGNGDSTPNAVTIPGAPPVQVIRRWQFATVEDLLLHFDFSVCRAAIRCTAGIGWIGVCDDEFYQDLAARRLNYRWPPNAMPGGSLLRVMRMVRRGYACPPETLVAIAARLAAFNASADRAELAGLVGLIGSRLEEVSRPAGAAGVNP